MKVTTITHSWPNNKNKHKANFVWDETHLLSDEVNEHVLYFNSLNPFNDRGKAIIPTKSALTFEVKKFISLPKKKAPTIAAYSIAKGIINHFNAYKPDVIHIHFLFPSGLALLYLPKHICEKIVVTIHGNEWYLYKESTLRPLFNTALTKSKRIICVSNNLKKDLLSELPMLESKVVAVDHGVDENKFQIISTKREYNFITVAGISRVKGLDILLDALIIEPELKSFNFHIIGTVIDYTYYKELLDKVRKNNLSNVKFLKPIHNDEIVHLYNKYHTFILPSRHEGFGISFIEAAACGCSLIGPNHGGPQEIINEIVGTKINHNNLDDVIQAIKKHATPKQYIPMDIRKNILSRFSLSSKKEAILSIYNSMC